MWTVMNFDIFFWSMVKLLKGFLKNITYLVYIYSNIYYKLYLNVLLDLISCTKCIKVFTDVPAGLWANIKGSNVYEKYVTILLKLYFRDLIDLPYQIGLNLRQTFCKQYTFYIILNH